MRLTKRDTSVFGNVDLADGLVSDEKTLALMRNKLADLEDIEDELGIDLIKKNQIEKSDFAYIRNGNNEIIKGKIISFHYKDKAFEVLCEKEEDDNNCSAVSVRCLILDYGKTWALTKEELENGNRKNN